MIRWIFLTTLLQKSRERCQKYEYIKDLFIFLKKVKSCFIALPINFIVFIDMNFKSNTKTLESIFPYSML